jgi:hypothetical protein
MIISGLPANRGSFASGSFADIDSDFKKHIINVRLNFNRINLLEPHTDANEYEVEILDKDLNFTNVMKDYSLFSAEITIKIGFLELNESDFVVLPSVIIEEIMLLEDLLTWRIVAKDNIFRTKQDLFTALPQSNLTSAIAAGAANIPVGAPTIFRDPTSPEIPPWVQTCVVIDNELKSYTGISGSNLTGAVSEGVTGDVTHEDDSVVKQAIGFLCDPLTALLHVLMTTDEGGNGYWDLAIPGFGLGIAAAKIEVDAIEKLGLKISGFRESNLELRHVVYKRESLEWIERTCLRPLACYLKSTNGKIDVSALDYFWDSENFVAQKDFANEEIIELNFEFFNPINFVRTQAKLNPVSGDFTDTADVILQDSVDEYGQNPRPTEYYFNNDPLILDNPGTFGANSHYWVRRYFDTYGDVSAKINFRTTMAGWLVEPGDYVTVTYDSIPDMITGALGWTDRRVLIVGQEIDFSGQCRFFGESYQMLNRVAGMTDGIYTLNEVEEIDIDDTDLAFNATSSATIQTEDAYYENTVTEYPADIVAIFLELEEPGTGTDNQVIRITTFALDNGGVIINSETRQFIRYDAAGSAVHQIVIYHYMGNGVVTPGFIKLDWHERSSSDPNDQPTITVVSMWFIEHHRDMAFP